MAKKKYRRYSPEYKRHALKRSLISFGRQALALLWSRNTIADFTQAKILVICRRRIWNCAVFSTVW